MRSSVTLLLAGMLLAANAAVADPAYIVVDVGAGTVLENNRSDSHWYPASVTKLMTAYVTFRALRQGEVKMTSPVRISDHALAQAPSKMGFKVGTILNVDNALKMMLVKSANDIAMSVAESVGGSEAKFAARMNAEAARLGMASTHYDNPNGLPDGGQLTTARDLAVLASAIIADFPEYASYLDIPAIKAGKRVLRSQNKLLEYYRGTTGMKTGFICASGYNIVATARRNGRTLVAVVLGATSSGDRNELAARLLDRGFAATDAALKPHLVSFQSTPTSIAAPDLRDVVCHQGGTPDNEEDAVAASAEPMPSALGPRVVSMAPVPVFTGRADRAGGVTAASRIPLPHLRPNAPGAASAAASGPAQGDSP